MSQQHDPDKHHRRSIRLRGWDYRNAGAYFVTIVTHGRECLFDDPILRGIAETMWKRIPTHFPHVTLDEWVVMPNHVHGILVFANVARKGEAFQENHPSMETHAIAGRSAEGNALKECLAPTLLPGSLGAVVGNFKSVTARRINYIRRTPGTPVWQRNFYERVIRNDRELNAIREYIIANPANWEEDTENPDRKP